MSETPLKYFELLYGSIHFPIQVINELGKLVYVNPAFTFQWGYSISELQEYSIHNDSELKKNGVLDAIKETFDKKEFCFVTSYADSLLKSKEITIPFFRTKIFSVTIARKKYVVLFHEDQTEIILTEEEVKKAREGNREAERLKDTFLNVLSHELRTPLNIILGYSSIIKESMKDKLSSEDKIYLDNLYSGSERLFNSITQMLEFAQLEAGSYQLKIETVDLISILKNSILNIKSNAAEKNLNVKTNYPDNPIYVDIDVQSIENALHCLLDNAVKFTRQGFIEVETKVLYERELAVCKIKDTGVGISTEYLDHLFRPFSQEDLNIGRNFEGNGLGLALSKRYIEKAGGSLLVDSIKGVGSTFTFTLPLSQSVIKNDIFLAESSEGKRRLKKILMLDDQSESYELLTAFLKNTHRIDVHNFRNFKIDFLKDKEYSIIVFDVNQNHWKQSLLICKDIKKNDNFKRSLMVISSEFMDDKIKEFYEAGADIFLVKPFSKKEFITALAEFGG